MNNPIKAQRLKTNTNLSLHFENNYQGLPVMVQKGPLIRECLDMLYNTAQLALEEHARVFAVRFDLRLPDGKPLPEDACTNKVIQRFIDSLKAKIKHARERSRQVHGSAHNTSVRYVWAREFGQNGKPHHHFVLLLNKDAYCTLGNFNLLSDNMYSRLHGAWASALGLSLDEAFGLVHFPYNAQYKLDRVNAAEFAKFFERASYLCKAATKVFGDNNHAFGCSRG
ncbi:MAG: inovirus Gp2 family protein [Gammaproteobacteria bacterium]|nr:inovirus Gp2 family protein [Gammaproteobacteria bacterium]MBU0818904.1 inovirus Gp2 family protein [Gammaproteobacteria bacterium]MBU0844308.1 inovirus Gp2 family protein [Gammaproteobacteria bacterium]MBU1843537.1 inovirus Gp2 family protein [Gammaproteobacteria bacterium]